MSGAPDMPAPSLTDDVPQLACDGHDGHCITCSDEATPMVVLQLDEPRGLALCADESGAHHTVETALVGAIQIDERLLVHAGTAIAALPAIAALREPAA